LLIVVVVFGTLVAMILAGLINFPIVRAGAGVFGCFTFFGLFVGLAYLILYFPVTQLGKTYIVGLTDKRFMVIRIKTPLSGKPDVKSQLEFTDYQLQSLPPVETSVGGLTSFIKINDSEKPFEANFAHAMNGNREQVEAIAAAFKQTPVLS